MHIQQSGVWAYLARRRRMRSGAAVENPVESVENFNDFGVSDAGNKRLYVQNRDFRTIFDDFPGSAMEKFNFFQKSLDNAFDKKYPKNHFLESDKNVREMYELTGDLPGFRGENRA